MPDVESKLFCGRIRAGFFPEHLKRNPPLILLAAMFARQLVNPAVERTPKAEIAPADRQHIASLDSPEQPGRQLDLEKAQPVSEDAPFPVIFIFVDEPEATRSYAIASFDIRLDRSPLRRSSAGASRS